MRRIISCLVLMALILPLCWPATAPASALPGHNLRRAEVPGLAAARLAARGLQRLAERGVLRLAGAQARQEVGHAVKHEVRRAVDTAVLGTPAPAPVPARLAAMASQRLQDLTAHALAQVRGEPLRVRTALAV